MAIFTATIMSKLSYGLASACLSTAEQRRLDGFQSRCLRKIWGIKPAFVSRVSNKAVLEATGTTPLSRTLMRQKLLIFGKVVRAPASSVLRDSAFCPGQLRPATDRYVRKVGRPRREWVTEVSKVAEQVAGAHGRLADVVCCRVTWERLVDSFMARG